ncbi:histidine acid phosphatase-2 [Coleophoma cylindrospora]|uniref:Histidine acid phosphatase-2 n=1 Tax=Coleophoma cylindrospora TaxID=1849047 RepID=A0A3D8S7Y9_9HELO|nr:histidine acid phosphatase-2 [Coleophoma cylindrospora]
MPTMRINQGAAFMAAAASTLLGGGAQAAVDLGWYPPNATVINSLAQVLNGTDIYGFVYNSSSVPDSVYGTYNWCNMPHVRATEYQKPSAEYQLQYVEVIHRHHKRTVYASNAFPVESYGWDCDDEGLFYYGQPKDGRKSAHTYWQGYTSPENPFVPSGFLGSCQFPQITAGGLDDSWQHGKDLYGVYHDLLGFLPNNTQEKATFRVTQNVITSEVAGMVINGMFGTEANYPLLIQASGIDSLEPAYSCAVSSNLFSDITSSTNWQSHLTAASTLYSTLDDISGVDPTDSGFHASFDHYYDNLSARQCHAKPLPCKLVNGVNSTTCVTQSIANEVYRMGNWEYSYKYRDDSRSLAASATSYGVWVGELTTHIRDFISGKSNVIWRHNVAHDGSISRLLSVLQIDVMVWPGMGSEVVFELYKKDNATTTATAPAAPSNSTASGSSGYFIRVLWAGQVLRSSNPSLGLMDMVPLETVLAYFDGLVGVGANLVHGKCNGTVAV